MVTVLAILVLTLQRKKRSAAPRNHTLNPFRTAVPFWGQSSQISSCFVPKRDCGSKGVNTTLEKKRKTVPDNPPNNYPRGILRTRGVLDETGKRRLVAVQYNVQATHDTNNQVVLGINIPDTCFTRFLWCSS